MYRSGPVPSLMAKWLHYLVFFYTYDVWPGILQVILPQTTHSSPIRSSYWDHIVYTLSPYAPPPEFKLFKKVEGVEKAVAPG